MCKAQKISFFENKTSWVGGGALLFCVCGDCWETFKHVEEYGCVHYPASTAANLDMSLKAGAVRLDVCFRKLTGGTQGPPCKNWAGNEERWPGFQPYLMSDSEDPNRGRGEG